MLNTILKNEKCWHITIDGSVKSNVKQTKKQNSEKLQFFILLQSNIWTKVHFNPSQSCHWEIIYSSINFSVDFGANKSKANDKRPTVARTR